MGQELKQVEIKPYEVKYPEVTLWRTDIKDTERIKIINPKDFPKDEILDSLGISKESSLAKSFGICDEDEIRHRISLMQLLIDNKEVAKWLRQNETKFYLPGSDREFINFYDMSKGHNPYWEKVIELIKLLDNNRVPARLRTIVNTLEGSLVLEESERQMAVVIADRMQNIAVIEGLMNFRLVVEEFKEEARVGDAKEEAKEQQPKIRLCLSCIESKVHGHRMYSFDLNRAKKHKVPAWTENMLNPLNWIGIGRIARWYTSILNRQEIKKAYDDMVITESSSGLVDDVALGVVERLNKVELLKKKEFAHSVIRVYFSYSEKGLWLRIYGIEPHVENQEVDFSFGKYEGYSQERLKIIEDAQAECIESVRGYTQNIAAAQLLAKIKESDPSFFEEKFPALSLNTDKEHRWYALNNLYNSPALKPVYEALSEHRRFLSRHLELLESVLALAAQLEKKAEELQTPVCYPEILADGQSMVDFGEIFPIYLLHYMNGEKPMPIKNLSPLNGNIVGFTGFHGGGKTVTEQSITADIYLAQSGLPVFGTHYRQNIKKALGMVFIEGRGKGSTCELLLKKMKKVLEGIQGFKPGEVVLILDELGSATQEASGLELGKDVLNKLSRSKVSVLFSTQITNLAEYAESNLGAKCFQFDAQHRINHGIGTGHMEELRKKIGIDALLK